MCIFDLVKTATEDNLYLHGLFKKGDKKNYTVLHIHGFEDDFFKNQFITVEANALLENGHSFLSVQTRGTGSEFEIKTTENDSKMIGSHLELLKEAYMDIDAWIEYLIENGFHNIVLQGHSMGSVKAVRYLAEGAHTKYIKKLILLTPIDVHAFAEIITDGKYKEYLSMAKKKIEKGEGEEIIPESYINMRMSYQTFASYLTMDHFGKMFNFADEDNNFMLLNKIDIPVKAIVGNEDELFHPINPTDTQEAIDIMKLNIKDFEFKIIEGAGHTFFNKEHDLTNEVLTFLET